MSSLKLIAEMAKGRFKGNGSPEMFKINQLVEFDISAFILLAGTNAHIQSIIDVTAKGVVTEIQTLTTEGVTLYRLVYTNDQVLQVAVDTEAGVVTECRWFKLLDSIPVTASNYLDFMKENEGMIGWWQFQTLGGVLYDRFWQPYCNVPAAWVEPVKFTNTITKAGVNKTAVPLSAEMYFRATGSTVSIAPSQEYLLVEYVEGTDQKFNIWVGYDLLPASVKIM